MFHGFHFFSTLMLIAALTGCAAKGPRRDADAEQVSAATAPTVAQRHVQEAIRFQDRGLLDAALAEFGRALEENPTLTEAHLGMGNVFRQRGEYALASNAYERAVNVDPDRFDANYYLGLMRQLMGMVQEAIISYRRALAIWPDSPDANRDLASALLQLGRPDAALPYALRAVELDPTSQAAWCNLATSHSLLGQYRDAINAYREAAELGVVPDPLLPGLADAHLRLGNHQRAINVLRALVKDTPSPTAHERLGYALFKLRQFEEALRHYELALELDPDDTAALNGMGACLMTMYIQSDRKQTELRDAAFDAWRRSVKIRPDQNRIVDLLARYSVL